MKLFQKPVARPVVLAGGLCLLVALALAWGAWSFVQRARQVRTFADLQSMVWQIEQKEQRDLRGAVESVAGGRDGWGNKILVVESEGKGYLLISKGSDGTLDVQDASIYFEPAPNDIRGDDSSDIVFRNGHPLTLAGK